MNLYEAILRANEEYTPKIQELKDYIQAQHNEIKLENGKVQGFFNLDPEIEWDYVLTLEADGTKLEFSQFEEEDPIVIELNGKQKKVSNTLTPEQIIKEASSLLTPSYKEDEEEPVDVNELTQCVVKVKDLGNGYLQYNGILLDATDYVSEYDMEVDFQDRLEDFPEDEFLILAYHEDGELEFYDQDGYPIDLNMSGQEEFEKAYDKAIKDNPTVPVDADNL